MRYDFVDLNIFLTLARTLNLTNTAEEVHLTTAAVSVRLKKLEDALGVKLFERGPRGVRMTSAATALRPHVLAIWSTVSTIEKELRTYQTPADDTLTIATNTTGLQNVFCRAGRVFLESHCVRLRVLNSRSAATAEAVIRGNVDLGFGLKRYADLHVDSLEIIPFMTDRLVALFPEGHPLAERETVDFATFLQYDHLSLQEDSPITQAMRERARNRGCQYKPLIQLPNFDQIIRYVEAGIGAAVVPLSALGSRGRFDDGGVCNPVKIVPLSEGFSKRTLCFMLKKENPREGVIRELIECCREAVQENRNRVFSSHE